MSKIELTADRLRELLNYDPDTGVFTRILMHGKTKQAGIAISDGYRIIRVDRRSYGAHRLAWLYTEGALPVGDIDHINGDRADNRRCNLRSVTRSENLQNQRTARSNSQSGFLGVCKVGPRWQAQIKVGKKAKYLGLHATPELAYGAYLTAKRKFHSTCSI